MPRARGYDPLHTSPDQDALLARLDAHVQSQQGAVGVFDLDGCLFDTRPRQIQILNELASQRGWPELCRLREEHFTDWSLRHTMSAAGLNPARIEALYPTVKETFYRNFFLGDYLVHDRAMPGAAALVWACYRAGLQIVYLTGRHDEMRAGTEAALRRWGFPYGRPKTSLLVKPDRTQEDLVFKGEALREIGLLGKPCLFLDNEPANINLFYEQHPDALCIWVETDHSPRPFEAHSDLPTLRGFLRQHEI